MAESAGRVVIVGAGIVGLATACTLADNGFDVTVIERAGAPGDGSSKANAGQLLFDRIGAMGSPGFLRSLPNTFLDPSQGVRAGGLVHPSHWRWAGQFLGQCTAQAWRNNTARLLELAHGSQHAMAAFRKRHPIEFDWRRPGKLVVQATAEGLEAARRSAEFQARFGGKHQVLSAAECVEKEPALAATRRRIAGAIYLPDAEVGDCNRCCHELARVLVDTLGGTIRFDTVVTGIERRGGRVAGLRCGAEVVEGDLFVFATGMDTPRLLRRGFDGRKPLASVLGVSLTFPVGDAPPELSVTDAAGRFVLVRLGSRLRAAGYAIFSDDRRVRSEDVRSLIVKATDLMPGAADFEADPEVWVGARPQTPDDLPMIGRAGAANLFVNAGHGSLGWTLAFGSAAVLMQEIKAAA